jgi:glycosyltransferase involved in cell wall biosynthesis
LPVNATVVVCAHNEEAYIREALEGILKQSAPPVLIVLVADRCTDRTVQISRALLPKGSILVEKGRSLWKNSYAENLEIGRRNALGELLAIIDADILVPSFFLERLSTFYDGWASVSALVRTDPRRGWLNRIVSFWERSYALTPIGREARGGARMVSLKALGEIGGFQDVMAPDTDLDIRLRQHGLRVRIDTALVALHLRRMSLARSVPYQIRAGRARRELGVSILRTLAHSIVRLRPFVLYGYLQESLRDRARGG